MAKHQPEPFEYRHGRLLDNLENPVDFKNPANLALIGAAFAQLYATQESVVDVFDCLKHEFKSGPKVIDSLEYYQDTYYTRPL